MLALMLYAFGSSLVSLAALLVVVWWKDKAVARANEGVNHFLTHYTQAVDAHIAALGSAVTEAVRAVTFPSNYVPTDAQDMRAPVESSPARELLTFTDEDLYDPTDSMIPENMRPDVAMLGVDPPDEPFGVPGLKLDLDKLRELGITFGGVQ